jgi:signal transduction histidine kinase
MQRMNTAVNTPLEKLRWFKALLGLDAESLELLSPHRHVFTGRKEIFARDFFRRLVSISETRIYLDHQKHPGHLEKAWAAWFALLFNEDFSETFLTYQWRSGLRHVEVGVDHRFITLGYSYLRQFCQETIKTQIPSHEREALLQIVDKMVDLCLLVETQAFIEATAQCDIEVVRGISHQARNPLTVIGGYVARLKRKAAPDDPIHEVYDTLISENRRLESMVNDAAVYSEMFQKEALFSPISLRELIPEIISKLKEQPVADNVEITLALDPDASEVHGDTEDIRIMFVHLLNNAVEAIDRAKPLIRISSRHWHAESSFVEVEVFNTGQPLSPDEIAALFVPFNSTKPYGTGFGLSIARLAARKSLGDLLLEPVPGGGNRSVVKLPRVVEDHK